MAQRPHEVLIVEDQPIVRMMAASAIFDAGLVPREAGDAVEALQVLRDHPGVGLLFTDIELPGAMDGLVLTRTIHAGRADMEFIVTSGTRYVLDADLCNHGTFLRKPYSAERLLEIVHAKFSYR